MPNTRSIPIGDITHCDQVWSSDITYVPMHNGFMYLVAIMDWFSRYVLAWQLSNTLDTRFCLEALEMVLEERFSRYFQLYNHQRPHQSLEYKTPAQVYTDPLADRRHR